MLRAQLLGGTPSELLGAITGLTEARFPVHAAAHFSDGFPAVSTTARRGGSSSPRPGRHDDLLAARRAGDRRPGRRSRADRRQPSLGRFVALRDAFGNTYVYAQLGDVAAVYPVLEPRVTPLDASQARRRPAGTELQRARDGRRAAALAAV